MNDHQGKALREGCHEREWAWTCVSSTEKANTKRNLARATTKSKSETQTVTNGHVGQKGDESCCWRAFQRWRPHRVSKIEAYNPQDDIQEGQRLMIIELERYNEIGELLIENSTTGFQGHICYWNRVSHPITPTKPSLIHFQPILYSRNH